MLVNPPPAVLTTANARPVRNIGAIVAIVFAVLMPFFLYFDTAKSIVSIWDSSETFAHGYIIVPISLWLIWRRRDNFRIMPPTPAWSALLLVAGIGFGWLLARMGEVQVVMQYAFALLLVATALAMLGWRLAGSLAFPLLFILLAIPFGEVFIDSLISFTADFTVRALQLTGIPVLRSGNRFEIPSGSWSVVDACSGVRYLISSFTLGCLYAYLTYRSTLRRALFIGASIVVPIIANGMRAYMIVMIGHLSGMKLAVGVDHLIYGWLFFGLVMFLLFWIGTWWREDDVAPPRPVLAGAAIASPDGQPTAPVARRTDTGRLVAMAIAVTIVSALAPSFGRYIDRTSVNPAPVALTPPAVGWTPAPAFTHWTPRFAPPDARIGETYQAPGAAATEPVGLTILFYRNQRIGKTLISSTNRLTGEKDEAHVVHTAGRTEQVAGAPLGVRESTVLSAGQPILVWQWNWIGGSFTASDVAGKLLQAKEKLLLRGDDGAALLLSAPFDQDPDKARRAMRQFLEANLPAIRASLTKAHGR